MKGLRNSCDLFIEWFCLGAYLISQIPLPEFGLGRSDPQLGFELQRDLSEYSDEYYDGIEVKKKLV